MTARPRAAARASPGRGISVSRVRSAPRILAGSANSLLVPVVHGGGGSDGGGAVVVDLLLLLLLLLLPLLL